MVLRKEINRFNLFNSRQKYWKGITEISLNEKIKLNNKMDFKIGNKNQSKDGEIIMLKKND